jgi:hypothetical protein
VEYQHEIEGKMRYVFGTLALLAAIIIVGYSATNLFTAAYTASAEPWQQMLNGTGAAAIVIWEATALILIGAAWHRGYKPVAAISGILLIVAMCVTLVWEMRTVIGGRADKFASREMDAAKLKGIDADMEWLRKRRETLTARPSSTAVRKEMDWISTRIESLEKDRGNARAIKEVMPEAAWSARMFGGTEQLWNDILTALPLLFWMLARVAAAPLAVAALVGRRKEDRTAAKADPAPTVARASVPPVLEPAVRLEPVAAPDPEPKPPAAAPVPTAEAPRPTEPFVPRVVETTPLKPRTKAERQEAVVELTRRWFKDCATKTSLLFGTPAKHAYKNYSDWCYDNGEIPVSDSHFGRSVRRLKIEAGKTAQGATYGLQLQRGGRSAARAIA